MTGVILHRNRERARRFLHMRTPTPTAGGATARVHVRIRYFTREVPLPGQTPSKQAALTPIKNNILMRSPSTREAHNARWWVPQTISEMPRIFGRSCKSTCSCRL
uniref:Uncharacterized protein n=1 Tax=Eutreptiella gymnastica TaxID=73025 RepID=A0A7S4G5S3_9EUGL